jgi:tRNA(adenine34) deaminase
MVERQRCSENSTFAPSKEDSPSTDEHWMRHALNLAHKAAAQGEVPVGAVIIDDNALLAEGWNRPIQDHDPSAHAEIVALRAAGEALENYRLVNTTLYVTIEPCTMCAGAIMHARVKRLVYGAADPKAGADASVFNLLQDSRFNHRVQVVGGVLAEECGALLSEFFRDKRKK